MRSVFPNVRNGAPQGTVLNVPDLTHPLGSSREVLAKWAQHQWSTTPVAVKFSIPHCFALTEKYERYEGPELTQWHVVSSHTRAHRIQESAAQDYSQCRQTNVIA